MKKHTDEFLQFAAPMKLTQSLDSREYQNLDPYWKSQPVTCKVDMEWKSELNLWTKTILTRRSEFLMD